MLSAQETLARAQADLDSHIDFLQKLLPAYTWGSRAKAIQDVLDRVNERRTNPVLYLGVLGEFSSGKSTFINALLRDNLLLTDILQATTSAVTQIVSAVKLDAKIELQDDQVVIFSQNRLNFWERLWYRLFPISAVYRNKFEEFVRRFTADEDSARHVKCVTIGHPSPSLQKGLVIVDTPGINSENARHTFVTQRAVREICDAAIVLIPANVPVSQTLAEFLRANLSDSLHRCIFLITKIDMIRPSERQRLSSYIRTVLQRELAISSPVILEAAPRCVLESAPAEKATQEQFVTHFEAMEESLNYALRMGRNIFIIDNLFSCLSRLFCDIDEKLHDQLNSFAERRALLESSRIPDLMGFVTERKRQHADSFWRHASECIAHLHGHVVACRDMGIQQLFQEIDKVDSAASLSALLKSRPRDYAVHYQQALLSSVDGIVQQIVSAAVSENNAFVSSFRESYQTLQALGGTLRIPASDVSSLRLSVSADLTSMPSGMALTMEDGFFDWVKQMFFGPALNELKQRAKSFCEDKLKLHFETCETGIKGSLHQHAERSWASVNQSMSTYVTAYGQAVSQMIANLESERATLDLYREQTEELMGLIKSQLQAIHETRSSLTLVG